MDTNEDSVEKQNAADREVHAVDAYKLVTAQLARFLFVTPSESQFQAQVINALANEPRLEVSKEVIADNDKGVAGRYDLKVTYWAPAQERSCMRPGPLATIVLELKINGSASAVERQAQQYAMTAGIDLVAVVTTLQRLALNIGRGGDRLGGKPFRVIAVRTF